MSVVARPRRPLAAAVCSSTLDLSPLRAHYSADLCQLLAMLLAKPASMRPTLRELLETSLLRRAAPPKPGAAPPKPGAAPALPPAALTGAHAPPPPRIPIAVRPGVALPPVRAPLGASVPRPKAGINKGGGKAEAPLMAAIAPAARGGAQHQQVAVGGDVAATKRDALAFGADTHVAAVAVQRSYRARHGGGRRGGGGARQGGAPGGAPTPLHAGGGDGHAAAAMAKINGLLDDARRIRGGPPSSPEAPSVAVPPRGPRQGGGLAAPAPPALSPELQRQRQAIDARRKDLEQAREEEEALLRRRREEDDARDEQRAAERAAKKEHLRRGY